MGRTGGVVRESTEEGFSGNETDVKKKSKKMARRRTEKKVKK